MSKKGELSTLTKGLIRKAHGGRKINNDFWYGSLENKQKHPEKKNRYALSKKQWLTIIAICLTLPYIVMHGPDIYKKMLLSDDYEMSFEREKDRPKVEVVSQIQKQPETTQQVPKDPKQNFIYVWKDKDNFTYFTHSKDSIPRYKVQHLRRILINRNNIYCWIDKDGEKVYTNGVPNTLKGNYRLISIK